jgi:pimeloyl-ACP methyl ester carboxylesterase
VIPRVADFLGDVLVYFHQQHSAAAPIREIVASAIRDAQRRTESADPLVVVAHSMGGSIAYDLLTHELADAPIALLVTAGTQVGLFEELGLFRGNEPATSRPGERRKTPRPANIARWINVFDYSDLLGFLVGPVIDGVDDFAYRTGSLIRAHSHYFLQPSFHHRLAVRARSSG